MKKIGKKLSYFIRLFLVCGLLFNHISPLATVLAEEVVNNEPVVGESVNNDDTNENEKEKENENDNENENENELENENSNENENTQNDSETPDDDNNNPSTEPEEELEFTLTISESDGGVYIKYSKAASLEEGTVLSVDEDFEYVDGTHFKDWYGDYAENIELTDDDKEALINGSYFYPSAIIMDNLYSGTYTFYATILDNSQTATETYQKEGGYVLSLYDGDTLLEPVAGVYMVPTDSSSVYVTVRVLPGDLSPHSHFEVGDSSYTVNGIAYNDVIVGEIVLDGFLYGEFTYDFETSIIKDDEEYPLAGSFTISHGDNQDNTDWLNESAENVGLNGKYAFAWIDEKGIIYVSGEVNEDEIKDIVNELTGGENTITSEVTVLNGKATVTLTDTHGVTVSYTGPNEVSDVKIEGILEGPSEVVASGTEFTVKYLVKLRDYRIHGVSGLFTYNTDMFELVDVSSEIFAGGYVDDNFLFLGEEYIPEENENKNEEPEEKEYVLVTATFKALMAGEDTITLSEGKFYDEGVYYTSEEDPSVIVTVEASGDNTLASLVINGVEVPLEEGLFEYSIEVENDATIPEIEAILSNDSAKIISVVSPEELAEGDNEIVITVKAANGEEQIYTIKVTRKASQSTGATVSPVAYYESTYVANTGNNDPQVVETPTDDKKDSTSDDKKENKAKDGAASRIIIIILILLVIAGLIYLIFKDDDDSEVKKANKDINKFKDKDIDYKHNENKHNNTNRNNNNNNTKKGR